ncbi:MAG: hypothetical protein H0V66_00025 [Bdellovibrionales bacterium]|nr:hypothetical protein [Bdellovibrionales bacterium]
MKLAILGSSPIALEAALRFHLHGASLTWFNFDEIEYEHYFQKYLPKDGYVSETGLIFLKEMGLNYSPAHAFDYQSWKQNYALPLTEFLKAQQKVRPHEVVSVSKRFLAANEVLEKKSRFLDLFRIIFQVNPQEFIQEQKESNPETFERLSKELVDSLQMNLEMYEDFDLVLDLRRATDARSVSVTGRALGEGRVSKDQLKYGFEALKLAQEIAADAKDMREMALIGSGELAAEIAVTLTDWLRDERSRLFIVSQEAWPFQKFLEQGEVQAVKELNQLFEFMNGEFLKEVNDFHGKLREWQALDDFVQAKIQKPVEPIPRLVFFSGHNATAVDQLIDKRRLFLTLEKPDFREGLRQPENNPLELKTIGVDRIMVANKLHKPKLDIHLDQKEVGHFDFEMNLPNISGSWSKDLEKLKGIENEIFKLFSPAGAH